MTAAATRPSPRPRRPRPSPPRIFFVGARPSGAHPPTTPTRLLTSPARAPRLRRAPRARPRPRGGHPRRPRRGPHRRVRVRDDPRRGRRPRAPRRRRGPGERTAQRRDALARGVKAHRALEHARRSPADAMAAAEAAVLLAESATILGADAFDATPSTRDGPPGQSASSSAAWIGALVRDAAREAARSREGAEGAEGTCPTGAVQRLLPDILPPGAAAEALAGFAPRAATRRRRRTRA